MIRIDAGLEIEVALNPVGERAGTLLLDRSALVQTAFTGRPLRMPPILMVSPPGLGKTFYCRAVAQALRTTCIPFSINGTSDRIKLGGLSPAWRGAKTGKIAEGLLIESATAAPLYLLDEIDKPPALVAGEHAGRQGRRVVSAFIATAFAQDDAEAAASNGAASPTSSDLKCQSSQG